MPELGELDLQIAAHEVGHAVAQMAAGFHVDYVKLDRFGDGGVCAIKEKGLEIPDERLRGWLTGMLAGFEAEDYWIKTQFGPSAGADAANSAPDYAVFERYADIISLSEAEARSDAMQIVVSEWDVITRCAYDLARMGRLSGEMIR
jgi:hypothetical protein